MIQSVKYVSVLCLKEDKEKVLFSLQKCGEMMLSESENSVRSASSSADTLRRIDTLRDNLKPYKQKKGLFAPPAEIEASSFDTISESTLDSANESEKIVNSINAASSDISKLNDAGKQLLPWKNLKYSPSDLEDDKYVSYTPGCVPTSSLEAFTSFAEENGFACEVIGEEGAKTYLIVASLKDESLSPLAAKGFEKLILPDISASPSERLEEVRKEVQSKEEEVVRLKAKLSEKLASDNSDDILYEQYKAVTERETAPVIATDAAVIIEGWVPSDKVDKIEPAVKKATDVYDIEMRDPIEGESVPTVLKNNKIVSQFEGITNMFSVPIYGGVDPNPVMAPWYWIIFGLMMGDAGYGLMMLLLGLGFKYLIKPKGGTLALCNVILYSSITSIIAGVVFGSYFGSSIFPPLWFSTISFDGTGDSNGPIKMLIFTLVVGVLHIFTGILTKAYYNIKDGNVKDAIYDQFSWFFILLGICVFVVGKVLDVPSFVEYVGIGMIGIGVIVVLFTAGREKPNIIGKATGGLLGLYDITGYMSDILSYSRILALGLSTGVVGWVMNLLASMVAGSIPVLGWVFAILIYIVGHVFNLVLGLLSAYVHDSRLQYIEFYGKFYEGNGRLFKPFAVSTSTINIKNNITEEQNS